MAFYSRSAKIAKETSKAISGPPRTIVKHVVKEKALEKVIFWAGGSDGIRSFSKTLNVDVRDLSVVDNDLSLLLRASCVVLCDNVSDQHIQVINFAVNYGIPVVWIGKYILPSKWMWSFTLCFVGNVSTQEVWGELCRSVLQ